MVIDAVRDARWSVALQGLSMTEEMNRHLRDIVPFFQKKLVALVELGLFPVLDDIFGNISDESGARKSSGRRPASVRPKYRKSKIEEMCNEAFDETLDSINGEVAEVFKHWGVDLDPVFEAIGDSMGFSGLAQILKFHRSLLARCFGEQRVGLDELGRYHKYLQRSYRQLSKAKTNPGLLAEVIKYAYPVVLRKSDNMWHVWGMTALKKISAPRWNGRSKRS